MAVKSGFTINAETVIDNGDGTYTPVVGGNVASGATDSGNGIKVSGVFKTTPDTLTNNQRGDINLDSRLNTKIAIFAANNTSGAVVNGPGDAQAAQNGLVVVSQNAVYNGAGFDRAKKPSSTARLLSSAATTNANNIKNAAGDLFRFKGKNNAATDKWLKLYNKASAPTVGTDTPIDTIPLLAGQGFDFALDNPLYFSTGIAYAITGAAADADTTALAAGDITGLCFYYA